MREDLVITETNSGKDSKGSFLGLEGKLYFPACIALITSLCLYFLIFYYHLFPKINIPVKVLLSFAPLLGTVSYLLIFEHKKPPNYRSDLWYTLVKGDSFNHYPSYLKNLKHPLKDYENS